MKFLLTSLLLLTTGVVCAQGQQVLPPSSSTDSTASVYAPEYQSRLVRQTFNPVFAGEKEIDQIIGFISSNLVVELDPEQLKQLDGFLVITFRVDTVGMLGGFAVRKSYNSWVDYAILGGLNTLPEWGVPSYKGESVVERRHQIVFSFGSYAGGPPPLGNQSAVAQNRAVAEVDRQRREHYDGIARDNARWDGFTRENSRLEYDVERGLKAESQRVESSEVLPSDGSAVGGGAFMPTIRISD